MSQRWGVLGFIVTVMAIAVLMVASELEAVKVTLGAPDIERALTLARRSDAERARFHAPYIFAINDVIVERLEVITEFRRCVLIAEERLAQGNWMFTQGVGDANEALKTWRGQLWMVARLRFHLQNTFVNVPQYQIVLGEPSLAAVESRTTPLSSLPFQTPGGPATSLVGAVIEAKFSATDVGQARRPVSVILGGQSVARTIIDFARLD